MLCYFIVATILILLAFYLKFVKPTKYWQERDVPYSKTCPIFGSVEDVVYKRKHLADVLMDIYRQHSNERCVGYMQFTKPILMIRDLELIKRIAVKDFDHFHDHVSFQSIKNDRLLSKSLVSLNGENWKRMRSTLSPVFTTSKLKMMYELIADCAQKFTDHFVGKGHILVEMKDASSKFASNVIASTAFGVEIDCLNDPQNEFLIMGNKLTNFGVAMGFRVFLMELAPGLSNKLGIQALSNDVSQFFRSLIKDNIKKREEEGIVRPDLIHLLMQARKGHLKNDQAKTVEHNYAAVEESEISHTSPQMELTDDHIVAQALIFFLGGFDTVSTSCSFMAHELAVHPEVQKKLQLEIDETNKKFDGKVPYEALLSMKFLDQVVCETLRLWPPGFQLERLCVKDYVIEPKTAKEKVVFVSKGCSVMVPVMALHRDKQYFKDPNKFDPERFSDENKPKIVSGSYLPFGLGPRNCIGSRFALLEMKCLFLHLLSKFVIIPVDGTELPLKLSPNKIGMAPENGFQLALKPRLPS